MGPAPVMASGGVEMESDKDETIVSLKKFRENFKVVVPRYSRRRDHTIAPSYLCTEQIYLLSSRLLLHLIT